MDRAVAANFDLSIAVARLQQAREAEYFTGGGVLPGIGGTEGVSIVGAAGRSSGNESIRGRISGPVYSGISTTGLQEITHIVGFDAGWELDLFGRYTRLTQAARADVQAAAEFRNGVLISVVADVVRSYIDVRSLQLRLEIARENAESQSRTAGLVRVRFQRGLTNELDAVLAERQLGHNAVADRAAAGGGGGGRERRVAVLCGRFPGEMPRGVGQVPALCPRRRRG